VSISGGSGALSLKIPQRRAESAGAEPDIDRPAVTVVEINDPTIADQGIELLDLDALQLTSNPFRARRVVVRLEGGVVVYHSTNHRIRTRTKTQQACWLTLPSAPGQRER